MSTLLKTTHFIKVCNPRWDCAPFLPLLHLLVDGLCVCSLYLLASSFPLANLVGIFLTYNVLAFLSQPLTGIWADRMKRKHWMLLSADLLLTGAVLATSVVVNTGCMNAGMLTVAALLGIGNSLFHVWGGRAVSVATGNDIRALGVFVSTGAMGLAIGLVFFSWSLLYAFLLAICLLSVAVLQHDGGRRTEETGHWGGRKFSLTLVVLALLGLMVAVLLRSFVGEAFTVGITRTKATILLIGATSMLGKMAGGWIARRMGVVRMLTLVLVAVAVCLLFREAGISVLLLGLFAVNCTMPVTLYLANAMLPDREGLAFGLLAAALVPGYVLATI